MGTAKRTIQSLAMVAATRLSPSANKVLMLFFANNDDLIIMEQSVIQEQLKIKSKTTIVQALNELEEEGIIVKVQNTKDKRKNDYYLPPVSDNSDVRLELAIDEMLKNR